MRRSKIHQLRVAHIVSWADHTLLPASQAHSCITRKDLNEVIVRLPRLQSKLWILAQQHNRQDQTGWRPPSQELQHYHRVRLWNSGEEIVSWCFVQIGGGWSYCIPTGFIYVPLNCNIKRAALGHWCYPKDVCTWQGVCSPGMCILTTTPPQFLKWIIFPTWPAYLGARQSLQVILHELCFVAYPTNVSDPIK